MNEDDDIAGGRGAIKEFQKAYFYFYLKRGKFSKNLSV